jgi:hypothetical protein
MAVIAGASLLSACSGDSAESARPEQAEAGRQSFPLRAGVDARDPARPASVALVVSPLRLPRRAQAGSKTVAVFQARPDSTCQLEVAYDNGLPSQRLAPAIADRIGRVSWSWTTNDEAAGAIATAYVVCSGGQRGEAEIAIV